MGNKNMDCICAICGNKFSTNYKSKKYCSKECYLKSTQLIRANRFKQKHIPTYICCSICNNEFIRTRTHTIYCSDACREIAKQAKIKPEFVEKQCVICGKTFSVKSRTTLCCSDACHKKYRVIKQTKFTKKKQSEKKKLQKQEENERKKVLEQKEYENKKIQEQIDEQLKYNRQQENLRNVNNKLKFHKYIIERLNVCFQNNDYDTIISMLEYYIKAKLKMQIILNKNNIKEYKNTDELRDYIINVICNELNYNK